MIDDFDFEFDFREIEVYEKFKATYDTDANQQNQMRCVNALCNRASGFMQKASLFSQIAPHVEGAKKQNLCSQERYDAMVAAKKMLDIEAEDIKEEAEKFKSAFGPDFTKGEDIFKIVGEKLKKLTADAMGEYDLSMKFPFAINYKKNLAVYLQNKTKENKAKSIRALFDRTWDVMQKIPQFNAVAPRINAGYQNKKISEDRHNEMKAAKAALDNETAEIKAEAMRFKADFGPNFLKGEQIFPMVGEMKRTLMKNRKAQQGGHGGGGHGGGAPSFQNVKKSPVKAETANEKKQKEAMAKKAFRELEAEEKQTSKKKVRKHVQGSLGATAAGDLD